MDINVQLPEKLRYVFEGPARYRGAYGGRGGAKSVAFANMAILTMMSWEKPGIFLCTRELQKSLKDSVFSLIDGQIDKLGVGAAFERGREYIRCKNGSEFLFYGLRSNIAEVKGLHGVKCAWIEEAQGVSSASLTYLTPTIREDNSEIWATWNPDDEEDPIQELLVNDPGPRTRVAEINYEDNPWFPQVLEEERLECLRKTPEKYDWIWRGKFNINMEGAVYAKWLNEAETKGRFVEDLYDPNLPVHTAWDVGYSDYTAIWFYQVVSGEIRVIDYLEAHLQDIRYYAQQLTGYDYLPDGVTERGQVIWKRGAPIEGLGRRRVYRYGNHVGPHDAGNKLLAANGRSIVDQLRDFNIRMFTKSAVNQQTQIQMARKCLEQCWFDPALCKDGMRSLRKYAYEYNDDRKRYSDNPVHDIHSHPADAFEILAQSWQSPIMVQNIEPTEIITTFKDDLFSGRPKAPKEDWI